MTVLLAPTERELIKYLGEVSSVPETLGCDILFSEAGRLVGIQRKALSDLVASVTDGRLAKEVAQMKGAGLNVRLLIVEGKPRWHESGLLSQTMRYQKWTRRAHRNLLRSVQAEGIWVECTDDVADTAEAIVTLQAWVAKDHATLARRPGPVSLWGTASNEDWCLHTLQSFPGIGPKQAKRIYDYFGGIPLAWTCSVEELVKVPGVGLKSAQRLLSALQAGEKMGP